MLSFIKKWLSKYPRRRNVTLRCTSPSGDSILAIVEGDLLGIMTSSADGSKNWAYDTQPEPWPEEWPPEDYRRKASLRDRDS